MLPPPCNGVRAKRPLYCSVLQRIRPSDESWISTYWPSSLRCKDCMVVSWLGTCWPCSLWCRLCIFVNWASTCWPCCLRCFRHNVVGSDRTETNSGLFALLRQMKFDFDMLLNTIGLQPRQALLKIVVMGINVNQRL